MADILSRLSDGRTPPTPTDLQALRAHLAPVFDDVDAKGRDVRCVQRRVGMARFEFEHKS
jgi:hypothetical protein